MARLDRFEGLKQSELAEMLDLQPITLTRLLDRLCDCGMIERRPDPNDRRAKRLFLTDASRPLLERLGDLGEELMATALVGVERESVEKMVTQLATVKENLRQAIQQKNAVSAARKQETALWLNARSNPCRRSREEAPDVRDVPPAVATPPAPNRREPSGGKKTQSFDRRRLTRWGLFGLLPLALIVGGLLVRHRRPDHVDRQRLCERRDGRHLDRCRRHRQGRGRSPKISTSRPARFSTVSIPCSFRSRSTMPRPILRRRRWPSMR